MDRIVVEHEVPAEPDTTFEWLTDPVLLTRWWPSEAEVDVRPGGLLRMYWEGPDVTLRGEYRTVEAGRRLEHTWSWDHDDLPPRLVTITLTPSGTGTHVTVEHENGSEAEGSDYRDGWEFFLDRLAREIDV